jgi:hypothetical protein
VIFYRDCGVFPCWPANDRHIQSGLQLFTMAVDLTDAGLGPYRRGGGSVPPGRKRN